MPAPAGGAAAEILPEDQRWQELRRCLADATLPLPTRVAAVLILLFGLPAAGILRLTADHVLVRGEHTHLDLGGRQPLFIPPRPAALLRQLADEARVRRATAAGIDPTPWLFPGAVPGQPRTLTSLSRILRHHGLRTRPARSAALIALAAQLPAPVLAELLGITTDTAHKWATHTQPDWAAYLAQRATDLDRPPE